METILDIMTRIRTQEREFNKVIQEKLLGSTVLTSYNNKTYRIDDVDFTKKPTDTFETANGPISFIEYYKTVSEMELCMFNVISTQCLPYSATI